MDILAVKSFLDHQYNVVDAYVEGDDPTTTLISCGIVLLAAIVAETRSEEVLSQIAGLPTSFIEGVIEIFEFNGFYLLQQFADLLTAATSPSPGPKQLGDTVDNMMEGY